MPTGNLRDILIRACDPRTHIQAVSSDEEEGDGERRERGDEVPIPLVFRQRPFLLAVRPPCISHRMC